MVDMDAREPVPLAETPDRDGAFPRLSDAQIETLAAARRAAPHSARVRCCSARATSATTSSSSSRARSRSSTATAAPTSASSRVHGPRPLPRRARPAHRPGRLRHRGGHASRARCSPCRWSACASWSSQDPALGDLILRAYLLRRELLIGLGAGLRIVGLALLAGHAAAARVRRPQPAAAPLDRPGGGPGGRGAAAPAGRRAGGDAGRDLARAQVLRNPSNAELARGDRPAGRRAARTPSATSWSSGPARPGWPPPSTAPRRASRRSRSTRSPPAARPGPRRGSRTTSASRPASPARSWPSGRSSRPRSSARASACPPRRPARAARRPLRRPARRRHEVPPGRS